MFNGAGIVFLSRTVGQEKSVAVLDVGSRKSCASIRKHGIYMTPAKAEELISNPDLIISLAQEVKNLRSTTEVLQNQLLENRPKVIFADAVDASKDSVLIGNLAKLLNQNGVEAGQNKLFAWLRENGYLCNCKGERWNTPTQLSMDTCNYTA